ncbi:MAG: hypothetical protein HY721_26470 [Planctomycetes bacterium]|nr:hypothetical protein [Planctomycetota bacterium]
MRRNALTPDDAAESLETIRSVLDRTTRYRQISWAGIALAGLVAAAAGGAGQALELSPQDRPAAFLALWAGTFGLALASGWWTTVLKARASGERVWSRKLQVVAAGVLPAFLLGGLLTALLSHAERLDLAPGVWMGTYAVGILAVSHVLDWEFQVTAWAFLVASAVASFALRCEPHLAMGLAFGGIHLVLGAYRHFKEHPWPRA